MSSFKSISLAFALALGLSTSTLSAQALNMQQLEKGEVDVQVVEASQPYIQARGVFNAPVDKVWAALNDYDNYERYYQSVSESTVRSKQGSKARVYVKFDFPAPISDIWVLNEYTRNDANKVLSWRMLKGNLQNSDGAGSWSLKPYKGKTLATYRLNVNTSGASGWLQKQAVLRSTPGVFNYLNKQIR